VLTWAFERQNPKESTVSDGMSGYLKREHIGLHRNIQNPSQDLGRKSGSEEEQWSISIREKRFCLPACATHKIASKLDAKRIMR
jgi:hypothetical protein